MIRRKADSLTIRPLRLSSLTKSSVIAVSNGIRMSNKTYATLPPLNDFCIHYTVDISVQNATADYIPGI